MNKDEFKKILDRNGFDFDAYEFENEYSAKGILESMQEVWNKSQTDKEFIVSVFRFAMPANYTDIALNNIAEQFIKNYETT